jgi:hypothetical protein
MSHNDDLDLRSRYRRQIIIGWSLGTIAGLSVFILAIQQLFALTGETVWWHVLVSLLTTLLVGIVVVAICRTVTWSCWGCKQPLHSNCTWWCGFCGKRNKANSLLGKCERCSRLAPSYVCPHCGSFTYFESGLITEHAARPKRSVLVTPPSSDSSDSQMGNVPSMSVRPSVSVESSESLESDDTASDARPDLRIDLRDTRAIWTIIYFTLILSGGLIASFAIADAVHTSSFGGRHLLGLVLAIVVFGIGVSTLRFVHDVVVRWDCHNCAKRLESDVEWTCGSCDRDNHARSFLDKCAHCKAKPKAFECYHCGESTFLLEEERDDRTRARKKTEPRPGETVEEARRREIEGRQHEKRRLELDIELTALRAKLNPPRSERLDPIQRRQAWLTQQMEMAALDCRTINQCAAWKERLIRDIKTDPAYSAETIKASIEVIERYFEGIEQRITNGDIPLA